VTYQLGTLRHILFIYKGYYLLGSDSVQSGKSSPTLRMKILPPLSGSKSEPSKQSPRSRQQAQRALCEQVIGKHIVTRVRDLI
jgi:hypothetical protein